MMRWRDRERVMMMVEVKTYCSFCFFLFVCLLVFKYTAKKHAERVLRVSFIAFRGWSCCWWGGACPLSFYTLSKMTRARVALAVLPTTSDDEKLNVYDVSG